MFLVFVLFAKTSAQEVPSLGARIVAAARQQIGVTTGYDPAYVALSYPGGDIPLRTGVCSDVVVRALRQVGLDLQMEAHEDMSKHFSAYPQKWGLRRPDKNIDHRRVPNLMRYFERNQISMEEKLTLPDSYRPGDIVAWDLGSGVLHIGSGTQEEDILLRHRVIGHYRVKDDVRPSEATRFKSPASFLSTTNPAPTASGSAQDRK
jgi:uncharacterized protein YijF (DUF1287 family)